MTKLFWFIQNPETQELLKVWELELQRCSDICKLMENAAQHSQVLRLEHVHKVMTKMSLWRKSKLRKIAISVLLAMNQVENNVQLMEKYVWSAEARITLQQNASQGRNNFRLCAQQLSGDSSSSQTLSKWIWSWLRGKLTVWHMGQTRSWKKSEALWQDPSHAERGRNETTE